MHFRYARHTAKLESIKQFYTLILNLEILGEFKNHAGYDGVFLGNKGQNWHLEFTSNGEKPVSVFDPDNALVFYPETWEEYNLILENIEKHKVPLTEPKNPYWKENGICFEDCDHFPLVISAQKIQN